MHGKLSYHKGYLAAVLKMEQFFKCIGQPANVFLTLTRAVGFTAVPQRGVGREGRDCLVYKVGWQCPPSASKH